MTTMTLDMNYIYQQNAIALSKAPVIEEAKKAFSLGQSGLYFVSQINADRKHN